MSTMTKSLVSSFSQVQVMGPRVGRNAAAVAGACHNFSLEWISMILGDPSESAQSRMDFLSRSSGGSNPVLQKVFGERWSADGHAIADEMMLRIHGLIADNIFDFKNYAQAEIKSGLVTNLGKGFIYSFWFTGGVIGAEGGAHSVAFYTTKMGGQIVIHFFDPNFGEYIFTEDEFSGFWTELTSCYGPMKSHWMRSCTATKKLVLTGR